MVHIHHSQPLKIKFGTNHFLGSETFGPIQYREGVKCIKIYFEISSLANQDNHIGYPDRISKMASGLEFIK